MAPLTFLLTALLARSIAAASIYTGNAGWSYYGCYVETTTSNSTDFQRALPGKTETLGTNMTVPICQDYCAQDKYEFAGLEYTNECYCGFALNEQSTKVSDSECDLLCTGDSGQYCGGSLRLSVYNTTYNGKKSAAGRPVGDVRTDVGRLLALGIAVAGLGALL